jgi:hypothetical protein
MSHNGHAGIAYENQARAVLLQGNIATCSHIAFLWHHQIAPFLPVTEGVFGGMFGGLIDTYGAAQAQIPDFNDNTVWSSKYAFRVAHRRAEDRADSSPMVARRFHCWGVLEAFNLVNYSHLYSFWDSLWGRNTKVAGSNGAGMGTVSWEFSFGNLCIKNMAGGIIDQGNMWNYNAFPHSIKTVNVDKPISYGMLNGFGTTGPPSAHPAYGMMGPWSSATNYPVLMRPEVIYDITDFPLPYPLEGYGGFGATDAPGMAGTPKPYFWLDPASKTTLSGTDGMNTIAVSGAIVDRVGVRRFEDWQSPESQLQNMHMDTFPGNYHSTPQRLVERNGCFIQAGTWYMRMWFISYDRLDGSYFIPHIDITLTNFDPAFLAANTVDPMATMPNLPLKPEALRVEDIDLTVERVAPRIVTGPALDISENEPLNFLLQANSGIVSWSVTGVDGAKFAVRAGRYLQLVGGGGFDFENPQDAGANNVYNINLVATEPLGGLSTSSAFTITVIDKNEVGVPFWTDPFTRGTPTALKDLADGNPYWVKSPTSPASILTDGSGSFQVDDAVPTYYIGAPLSSGNLYEFSTMINHDGGYFEIQFGLDSIGGVSIEVFNVQNTWYVRTLDGTSQAPITTLLTASETYNYAQVMRMTYDKSSGAVTLYKQGVSIGSGTAPSGLNVRGPYVRSKACNVGLRAYKGFTAKVT